MQSRIQDTDTVPAQRDLPWFQGATVTVRQCNQNCLMVYCLPVTYLLYEKRPCLNITLTYRLCLPTVDCAGGLLRSVKAAAADWNMKEVMWMFEATNEDVESDLELMVEHREELAEMCKVAEKMFGLGGGTNLFAELVGNLKDLVAEAKARSFHWGHSFKKFRARPRP